MKKATILTLALLLTAATMASAGDVSFGTEPKEEQIFCAGTSGLLSRLFNFDCGPDWNEAKPPQPSSEPTNEPATDQIKPTQTKR